MLPTKPKHACAHPRCAALVESGVRYCGYHAAQHRNDYPRKHPEYQKLYSSQRWMTFRKSYLAEHPLCANYATCHSLATIVHHIVNHEPHEELIWNFDNLKPLCAPCHASLRAWNNEAKRKT